MDKIKSFISWFLFPVWIDTERITRKSKGIIGYIKSIIFYHSCFMLAVKDHGLKKAVKLYTEV